ncbi:MAG: hypothetical protein OXI43_12155 [Candidatus Poribacteria bacterium]|nr:hypothetical protein [Candidatus Poribacteria bacterium]
MAQTLSLENIAKVLKEQQKVVSVLDEYIQPIPLVPLDINNNSNYFADIVMQHIFLNIRHSYQDSIFISQALIDNTPYYISTALSHALRIGREFLIDLAYLVRDRKNRKGKNKGNEYLRYLKFMIDKEDKALDKSPLPEVIYNPTELDLKSKYPTQWSRTDRDNKIKQGLNFYKLELPDSAYYGSDVNRSLSSAAHGNISATHILKLTSEEKLLKLRADLTASVKFFNVLLKSALKCYVKLYLGRNRDYRELVKSINFNE